jgi:hypothetical protein
MKLLALLATVSATLSASAQPSATFEWKGGMEAGQTLEIRNTIGDIKAESAAGTEAQVSVEVLGTHPDPNTIRIDVVPYDGGILFCTIYEGISSPDHCTPEKTPSVFLSNSDIRVNYTVRVPAGAAFVAHTVDGNLSVDLPANAVTARTVNGQIMISAGSPANAATVNGSVLATLGSADATGPCTFATVNGSVDLIIPAEARASVRANTVWGYIGNDFGLQVHKAVVGAWMSGDVNGGGTELTLSTVSGSIHLRKPVQ